MIYTVTFNPAIDYVMFTNDFEKGKTNRSSCEEIYFGGKGINVSTVLARLGVDNTALGFIAGFTGEALDAALTRDGVKTDFIKLDAGHTRINIKLKSDIETEINGAGPEIGFADLDHLMKKLDLPQSGDTLVLAGSVPKTVPSDIYEKILEKLQGKDIRFVVDAEGELLMNVLKYSPFLIKPNLHELEEITGKRLESEDEIIAAAAQLKEKGAVNVLVSLGPRGAVLLDEYGISHIGAAICGTAVNTVGAGDSMVAGFLYGAENGYDCALKLGLAAGSATAFSKGLATKEEIMALL